MKALIHDILVSKLSDQTYRIDASSKMTKEIADEIKNRLKALELPRYCEHAHFPMSVIKSSPAAHNSSQFDCDNYFTRYKYMVQVVIGEQKGEGLRYVSM